MWRMCVGCRMPQAENTSKDYKQVLLFYCNNGCIKAPEYYVIHTFTVLFKLVIMLCALYGGETRRLKEFSVRCVLVCVHTVYYQKPAYFKRFSRGPAIWKTEGEGIFPQNKTQSLL